MLLGGRLVVHVCPSLGCRLSELFSRAAMRTPSATRRRRHRRPSGCAFCQTLHRVAPWRPWVRQQRLAAHAFSVSRALSNGSVLPLGLGRRRPEETLVGCCLATPRHVKRTWRRAPAISGLEAPRGDTVDAEMRRFNQVQNLLLSRRLRLHHPERCC